MQILFVVISFDVGPSSSWEVAKLRRSVASPPFYRDSLLKIGGTDSCTCINGRGKDRVRATLSWRIDWIPDVSVMYTRLTAISLEKREFFSQLRPCRRNPEPETKCRFHRIIRDMASWWKFAKNCVCYIDALSGRTIGTSGTFKFAM